MNRAARTKKLTLHKEALRRLSHRLTEPQLARVLGGNDVDCGAMDVPIRTHEPTENETCYSM
jgi:hypothetical protein